MSGALTLRMPRALTPLQNREFRLLWAGQSISVFGNFLHAIALPFQILAIGGTALQLGIGLAFGGLSALTLLLFGGALVDRWPRRRVILASDFFRGLVVTAIGILSATGMLRIEHLYVEAILLGGALAFFEPAIGAIMPEVVPSEVLISANALRAFTGNSARVAGPAAGGLLVGAFGLSSAFLVDGATFFMSFAILLAVRPHVAPPRQKRRSLLAEVQEGIGYTFSVPWLWVTIAGFAIMNAAIFGPLQVALPVLVSDVLGADARVFGVILAASGIGAVSGGLLAGQIHIRRTGIAMYCLAAICGGCLTAIGLAPSVVTIVLLSLINGLVIAVFGVLWESALQRHVPGPLLGRVVSVDSFGSMLLAPAAPVIFGELVQAVGPLMVFPLGGAVVIAYSGAALLSASVRRLE